MAGGVIWDFSPLVSCWNRSYCEQDVCLNSNICKYLVPHETNMSNFHQLEVVDRGSETQLQVGENLKYLIYRFMG